MPQLSGKSVIYNIRRVRKMAYILTTTYEYKNNTFQMNIQDLIEKFPFLVSGMIISGEILATTIENKNVTLRKPFQCKVEPRENFPKWIGIIGELNPLKERGIPPSCQLCVAFYKYVDTSKEPPIEYPIMEGDTIKSNNIYPFDDIVKKIMKDQEIRMIIESTTFHSELTQLVNLLRDSQIAFEAERYPDTKTSCRKIIENLRAKSKDWLTIDESGSVCEKIGKVMDVIFSFASVGGPHDGLNTKDETEFILKTVAAILFYINILMKNNRIGFKKENNIG
jgi:hypothetical protein